MITTIFIYLILKFLEILTSPLLLLADVTSENGVSEALVTVSHYIQNVGVIVPLTTLFYCGSLIIGLESFIFLYKIIIRIAKFFPGVK